MGYSKLNYIKNTIKLNKRIMKCFGVSYGIKRLLTGLVPRKIREANKLCVNIDENCNCFAMNYLQKRYLHVIKNYDYKESNSLIGRDSNIWIFWWQGVENAPEIVKACIESVKENAGEHQVVILDQYNYEKYVTLPSYIIDKMQQGKITLTHLSDLVRVELLYQWGGIWMDATLFMLHPFDKIIEESTFCSINLTEEDSSSVVRLGHWTAFFMASGKNNAIIGLLRELFWEYWRQENELIVYLLIDYFLTLIYRNVEDAHKVLDSIQVSNKKIFELDNIINQDYRALEQLQNDDTYIYKLSYKKKFVHEVNGKETVYHRLISHNLKIDGDCEYE